jgi:DNA-binding protein H-NS
LSTFLKDQSKHIGIMMKALNLEKMPINDLWQLYEQVRRVLAEQLTSEKRMLEQRLGQLRGAEAHSSDRQRRAYPKVLPKYQNPDDPSQTWAGRGRTPRWFSEMLTAGKSVDDLRIDANET